MALGELTKQLAQQALGNQMKDVIDALPTYERELEALQAVGPLPVAIADKLNLTTDGKRKEDNENKNLNSFDWA